MIFCIFLDYLCAKIGLSVISFDNNSLSSFKALKCNGQYSARYSVITGCLVIIVGEFLAIHSSILLFAELLNTS